MTPFILNWETDAPTLCPTCLEPLCNANVMFCANLAFCPLCAAPAWSGVRTTCLLIFDSYLATEHWACYRGLRFFTPQKRPKSPLQFVGPGSPDAWLLADPQLFDPSPIDDNPVCGGSPI